MEKIIRKRTIRPTTRKETSKNYKVDTKKVTSNSELIVYVNHESNLFEERAFHFKGEDIANRDSISFKVEGLDIIWINIKPN